MAWEDFQKVYGKSNYDFNDIYKNTSLKPGILSDFEVSKDIPVPTNHVNDYGEFVFPQEREDALNQLLIKYEKESGVEIAIVTVNTFNDITYMSSFAQDVFEKWGVGKSASDNGILIALSEADREWRIHTGYGAEIILPDLAASRLGEELLVPSMKAGDYTKAIEDVVNGIIQKVGSSSDDIKAFQDQYKAEKQAKAEQFKQGLLTTLGVIGLLSVMGLLIGILVRKYKKDKKLKDECRSLLSDIQLYINKFKSETNNPKDLDYINSLKIEFENYLNSMDNLPDKPLANQKVIDDLFKYNRELGQFILKAEKFNKTYSDALMTDEYLKQVKGYFGVINKMEDELSEYGVKSRNKVTEEQVDVAANIVKKNIGNANIFAAVTGLLSLVSAVKMGADQMKSTKMSVTNMESDVNNYESIIKSLIKNLKEYGLDKSIDRVLVMKESFEKLLPLQKSKLSETHAKLREIEDYANGKIKEIEDEKRRKEEAKRRKREEEEEEERRARRRREESSRSSYSSSYGSSRSSGSSFGGFGGGRSGGGGAGGRW